MQQEWQVLIENRTFDIVEENQMNHSFNGDHNAESEVPSLWHRVRSAESVAPSPQQRVYGRADQLQMDLSKENQP